MLPATASPFPYDTLPIETAKALRKQAQLIRLKVKTTTSAIINIGMDLIAAKQHLAHGQFSDWVIAECGFSIRTAQHYIRAAEFADGKYETVSLLQPLTVYKLACKSAPPELVREIMDRVESGALVTSHDVDAALKEARHQRRERERKQNLAIRASKHAIARNEARRLQEAQRVARHDEQQRIKALGIIDALGHQQVARLLEILTPMDSWQVLDHLRREFSKLDAHQSEANSPVNESDDVPEVEREVRIRHSDDRRELITEPVVLSTACGIPFNAADGRCVKRVSSESEGVPDFLKVENRGKPFVQREAKR